MKRPLREVMTEAGIRKVAGASYFARGNSYFAQGRVIAITECGADEVTGVVRGTRNYEVELRSRKDGFEYWCSCPLAERSHELCKHAVALALAWLRAVPKDKKRTPRQAGSGVRPSALEQAAMGLQKALRTGGDLDEDEMVDWAETAHDAIEVLDALFAQGFADDVVRLCESGLRELVDTAGRQDDPEGYLDEIRDRLEATHLLACKAGGTDTLALARRLFAWQLHGGFDVFIGALQRYKTILGEAGVAEYARLAEHEWNNVPAETVGHSRIRGIMKELGVLSKTGRKKPVRKRSAGSGTWR